MPTPPGEFHELKAAEHVSVVLLQPQQSLNVGSVARAMMNLGYSNLILVKPHNFDLQKAIITARWAKPILEKALFVDTLSEAIIDFNDVVGFGGRYDVNKLENISLPEWIEGGDIYTGRKIALLFGPEDRGLSTEEIDHCRFLVRIPSTSAYPSYNLAQSVLLVLYELGRKEWSAKIPGQEERELPTRNDFFQFERILDEVLTSSGFYRQGSPDTVPGVLKRLFQRMNPDKKEMGILLAMISRIQRSLTDLRKT